MHFMNGIPVDPSTNIPGVTRKAGLSGSGTGSGLNTSGMYTSGVNTSGTGGGSGYNADYLEMLKNRIVETNKKFEKTQKAYNDLLAQMSNPNLSVSERAQLSKQMDQLKAQLNKYVANLHSDTAEVKQQCNARLEELDNSTLGKIISFVDSLFN